MQDVFVRERTQNLSGLTQYNQIVGSAVSLVNGSWVDIYEELNSRYLIISAYQISASAGGGNLSGLEMRILAGSLGRASAETSVVLTASDKIFPHGASAELLNGVTQHLKFGMRIPRAHTYKVQVRGSFTTGTPTATLDFLSVIYNPVLDH